VRLLRVPGFGPLLAGQAVNSVGNWVAIIAIWGFASFQFDAGAGDIALLFVALSLPGALLGPLLGLPIDRLGPRRTLILANGLGFLNALALTQAGSYHALILLALPLGLIEALASASLDALPPRLVDDEDLVAANALLGGAQDLAIVVGPVVAALVNVRWGLPAPPATGDGPFPLIVFAHGSGGLGDRYFGLLRAWAGAGYVVAAPRFPFATDPDTASPDDYPNQPGDMSFLVDELPAAGSDGSDELAGLIDPERIGAAGHSLGGMTTLGLVANTCATTLASMPASC
jgi:MFS family permease